MAAPLKAVDGNADLQALMSDLGTRARAAARVLALAPPEQKNRALEAMERAIRANSAAILAANAEDVAEARASGNMTSSFIDRLTLTPARIEGMAEGIGIVRGIADPIGVVTERWQRPNGMSIERVRVPLGVVGRDLREPTQCRCRCRRAVPEVGQCRDPARRLRQFSFVPRHP
ncbi:hypothetical protein ABIA45_005490 [Bradyrhizobium sp. USDA 336]